MSQSWKSLCTSAALLLSMAACGTAPQAPTRSGSVPTAPEQSSGRIGETAPTKTNARSSFYQSNAANGSSQTSCAGTINGVEKKGSSESECKALKSEFAGSGFNGEDGAEAAANAMGDAQFVCSFNIDGKLYEGKSQAECEKLQKDLGISFDFPALPPLPEFPQAPNIPASPAQPKVPSQPSPQGEAVVSCSFNIDGKLYEGRSQAECDKLKKDLGLQF